MEGARPALNWEYGEYGRCENLESDLLFHPATHVDRGFGSSCFTLQFSWDSVIPAIIHGHASP